MSFTEKVVSPLAGDYYYKIHHDSGLVIYVYPKEHNNSTFAVFGTRFGSINTKFRIQGETEIYRVPDGIAHYLEHKLFESEEGDAFSKFSKTGASANAYTSFDTTCYLFSSAQNLYESLQILLEFVQDPYFTEENVKKEQGIIGQEIRMYEDDPQWRVTFNMLKGMYHTHPVREDIAGTVDSIRAITPENLYLCYHTFYNLKNMVLSIAGKVDPEKVLEICDKAFHQQETPEVERIFDREPETVCTHYVEQNLSVSMPLFQLGFKEKAGEQLIPVKQLAAREILLEILASDSSPLFRCLLDSDLINENSFDSEFFEGPGYGAYLFSGESKNPRAVEKEILKELETVRKEGFSSETFLRAKKSVYGRNISALNSADSVANSMASLAFSGRELFAYLQALRDVELEAVLEQLQQGFDPEKRVLSVIYPE